MIQSEFYFMTNCNEFTLQLESKLQWTGYKALTLFFRSFYRTSLFTKHKRLEDSNGNLAKSRISANVTSVLGGSAFFKNQTTYWNTKLWTGWILFCGYIPTNYILWRIKTRYNYWKEDLYFIHRETKTKQNKYFALKRQKGNFSV